MSRSPAAPHRRLLLAVGVSLIGTVLWLWGGGAPVGREAHFTAVNAPESDGQPSPETVDGPTAPLPTPRTEAPDEVDATPPLGDSQTAPSPTDAAHDSGGPSTLDDEFPLTLPEAADGVVHEPWSVSVELRPGPAMQGVTARNPVTA